MNRLTLSDPRDYLDWREGSGGSVEIYDIVVNSDRRRGRGKALVEELVRVVRKTLGRNRLVWAITRSSNLIAQQFYLAVGFRQVGLLVRFYPDNHDHGLMFGVTV